MNLQSAMWRCTAAGRAACNAWSVYNLTWAAADLSAFTAAIAECTAANLALQTIVGPPYYLASAY